jgi:ABC-type dipeptide/oligopeptide/nickel transport system permease component
MRELRGVTYVLQRVAYSLLVLFLVSIVTFVGLHVAPGDVTTSVLNPTTTPPEVIAALREQLGLDQPILVQYWNYLHGVLTGDLGLSLVDRVPVRTVIANSAGYTVVLAVAAFVVTFGLGIPLGAIAAIRKGGVVDFVIRGLANLLLGIPDFVLALLLIWVVAVHLQWLPVSGASSWQNLVMPAFVLAAEPLGLTIRVTRVAFLENRQADYVRTLRARGVSGIRIDWRHILRNSMTAVVSLGAVQVRTLLGYALIVEVIFRWPGLGYQLVHSILQRDYAVTQSLVLLLAAVVVISSTIGDLLLAWVDPRIRTGGASE